jgi:hypothetical protein
VSAEPAEAAVAGAETAETDPARVKAARAVAWLDTALTELQGALEECAECVEAGTVDPALISSKIQQLVMAFAGVSA